MRTRGHFSVCSWLATTLAYCAMSALSQEAVAGERVLKAVTKEGEVNLSVNARKVGTGSVEILASGQVSNADPSHQFTTLYQLRQITSQNAPRVLLGNTYNPAGVAFNLADFEANGRIHKSATINTNDLAQLTRWSDNRSGKPGERLLGLIEVQVQVKNKTTGSWLTEWNQPGTILYFESWNKGTFTELGTLNDLLKSLHPQKDKEDGAEVNDVIDDYVSLISMAQTEDFDDDAPFNRALGRAIEAPHLNDSLRRQLLSTIRPEWIVDNTQEGFMLLQSMKRIAPTLGSDDAALVNKLLADSSKRLHPVSSDSELITKDGAPKEPAPDSGGAPAVPATAVPLPTADAADSDKTVYATPLEAANAAIAAYRLKDSQKLLDMSVSPVAPELTDAYKPGTEAYEKFFKEDSELSQGVHKFKGQFTSVRLNDEAYVLIKTPSFFSGPTYVHMLREKGEFYYSPAEMVRVDKLPPPIALLPETDPDYKEIEARTAVVRKALASGSTDELGAVMAGDTLQKTIDYFTEFGEGGNFFGDGSAEAFAELVPKQLQIDAGRSRLKVVNIYRGQTVYFVLSSTGEPDTVTEVACCVIVAKQDDQWKLDRIRTMLALELPTQKFSF
ncbi:MAG: hypothetical protein R3C17_14790 [Planctomycetaceae bacterium]